MVQHVELLHVRNPQRQHGLLVPEWPRGNLRVMITDGALDFDDLRGGC